MIIVMTMVILMMMTLLSSELQISFSLFINERNKCILFNNDDDDKDSEDKDAHIRNGETVPK